MAAQAAAPGELPAEDDQVGIARLLHAGSDAAAAQHFTAAPSGTLHFVHAGAQYSVCSQLPAHVTQLTGQLVQGEHPAFQPHRLLAFHNSAADRGGIKLLQQQRQPKQRYRLGGLAGQEVDVGLAYDPAGKQPSIRPVQGTNLGLLLCKERCLINMWPAAGQPKQELAQVRTQRQLVFCRVDASNTHAAPYWRAYDKHGQWEVGCVALYSFPGDLITKPNEPPPPLLYDITAAAGPAAVGQAAAPAPAAPAPAAAAAAAPGAGVMLQAAPAAVPLPATVAAVLAAAATAGSERPIAPACGATRGPTAADSAQLLQQFQQFLEEPLVDVASDFALSSDVEAAADSDGLFWGAAAGSMDGAASEESLPDLEPPAQQVGVGRELHAPDDKAVGLQTELLRVAAGWYGPDSLHRLRQLLPLVAEHNSQHPQQRVVLAQFKERWFLERSVLHLLVSTVRVWGQSGLPVLHPLPSSTRQQLLDELCGSDPSTLKALLRARNRNQATPWFTAAHFCNLKAVEWLVSRPELMWRDMLLSTKRGKLFYHITSTQAAAGANTEEDRQRLRQGLVLMLKALANSFQQWLERQSPARVQHHKDLVELRQQQRRQRNQQRLRSELQQRQLTDMRSLPSAALAVGPVAPAAWAAATPAEAGSGARAAAVASDELQLLPQSLQAAAAAAGALVAQPGRSGPSGAAAGGSRPVQGSVAVSEDVLWFLERYMIFHTEWRSSRASSPPYNGALLQEVVVELFGFSPRHTAL